MAWRELSPEQSTFEKLLDRWVEQKTPASTLATNPIWRSKLRSETRSELEWLLDTGLLKLVEERPEPSKDDLRRVVEGEVRRYESDLRKLAEDDSGHHPEGEPSDKAIEFALSGLPDRFYIPRAILREALKVAYRIDHPQDREAK